ncbi:acyltransferase [Williamsia sp. CHRR-6]|uniref:acyltransferase n=1 Tax=Williamsia sp. CHRR-6 TaxID=2835871 RepID=UPI001BDAC566|nr:acyltransferase [Williamsia sp. CHRR-6]MBT0568526.1 acyltransferase [Williamsia sp. CHRR-6]
MADSSAPRGAAESDVVPGPEATAADLASPQTSAPKPKSTEDKHLHQIDFVRMVTFGGVILDHVMLGVAPLASTAAGAVELLLRYTRYGFFALTGFVLTYQYRHKQLKPVQFWRRRFKLIGLPFLTWSLFYWFYLRYVNAGTDGITNAFNTFEAIKLSVKSLGYDLITGRAEYHLYFLSVSMQIYVVFPALLWLLRKTDGHHRYLLLVSGLLNGWLFYGMLRPQDGFLVEGVVGWVWRHLEITLLPYQFFVLAGAVAAFHFEAFHSFMTRRRLAVFGVAAIVITATLLYYLHVIDKGGDQFTLKDNPVDAVFRATNAFALQNAFAFIAIILTLYGLGTIWRERRRPGSTAANTMRTAADRSFGIYLAHAVALDVVMRTITPKLRNNDILSVGNVAARIVIVYALTVALTVFIVEVLRRSPISLITTGRERLDWKTQNGVKSLAVAVIALAFAVPAYAYDHLLGKAIAGVAVLLAISAVAVLNKQRAAKLPVS